MAKKIGVLDVHQNIEARPQTYVKKSVAQLLIRRLLAEWAIENVTIRRRAIRMDAVIPRGSAEVVAYQPAVYEHHIEPRIETFGFADTEWLRYLNGFQTIHQHHI